MPYKLNFSDEEKQKMRDASNAGHASWSSNNIKSVKTKIKSFSLEKSNYCCCYCGRNQHGEFSMVIDIEHILPKSIFLKHMFTIRNLSTSCKRCNMNIKNTKVDFLSHTREDLPNRIFRSRYYKFIHPNLDKYSKHLELFSMQRGQDRMIKYSILNDSQKGSYTYEYFKLKDLEIDTFDKAQGGSGRSEINNPRIAELMERRAPE